MEDRFQVGVITTTHGVRGEVKVFPTTDDVKRFKRLKKVILDTGKEEKILEVEGARFMKNLVLLKFKGYDSINDIEKYKGCSLYVTREDAVRLRKDEYFVADLIGMEVFLEDGSAFGKADGCDDHRRQRCVCDHHCRQAGDPSSRPSRTVSCRWIRKRAEWEIHLLPGLME